MKILNSKGEPVVLNEREQRVADVNQRVMNALGYEIDITTLTTIMKKITEQKFFEVSPADYLPVRVGEGAWSSNLTTYRSFNLAEDFSTGLINTGGQSSKLASADAGVDSLTLKVLNWAKTISWSLFDIQLAAKSGNWDIVTTKERARKKNWDLGVQKLAFLGIGNGNALGLLNQAGVTVNAGVVIPTPISSMTTAQLKTFTATILQAYRSNAVQTAWPSHFIIPESDYLGLASPAASDFPIRSTLSLLEETFRISTKNPNFKILPLAYADFANSSGVLTKNRYTLLNYEEESLRMDVPVDYTNTLANSTDNFSFQNVGYGQVTGVLAYRPREMLYLDLP